MVTNSIPDSSNKEVILKESLEKVVQDKILQVLMPIYLINDDIYPA